MSKRLQELRSESGVVSVGTVIGLVLVAVAIYIALAATSADTDRFGSTPVPGTATLELSKGDIEIYYSQKTSAEAPFALPIELAFGIIESTGTGVEINAKGDESEETDDGVIQLVGAATIPADGIYTVEVAGAPPSGALQPELTLGQSPLAAMVDRVKEIGEQLIGPLGVVILVALLLLYYLPRMAQKSKKDSDPYNEF